MDNIKQNISETNKITNKDEYITNTAKKAIVKAAIALIVLVTTALILTRDLSRSYIEEHSLVGTYALGELLYDDDGNSYYDAVYEFESNGTVKGYNKYYDSFEYDGIVYGNWAYNKFDNKFHFSWYFITRDNDRFTISNNFSELTKEGSKLKYFVDNGTMYYSVHLTKLY